MATQPVENIDAVLGRFQAWTGARNAVEPRPGIREIPYEEALESGRYRWNGAKRAGVKAAGKTASAAAPAKAHGAKERRAAKKVRARGHVKAAEAKAAGAGRASAESRAGAGRLAAQAKGGGENHCAARPAFREVLAETVRPAEVVVAQPSDLARQAAISIRLAPGERALIKARAAEAGITASAYIRQCALDVEQLRAQVREAVAAMERGGQAVTSPPVIGPAPARGLFARIARRFFPRRVPVLALRA